MDDLRILNILLDEKYINSELYEELKSTLSRSNKHILETLEERRILKEDQALKIISKSIGVPYINLNINLLDKNIVSILPEEIIRQRGVIPIFKIQNNLTVGMLDPTNLYLLDELKQITKFNITPLLITRPKFKTIISQFFGVKDAMTDLINKLKVDFKETYQVEQPIAQELSTDEAPIIKLVNMIIEQALNDRASDIHIEPQPQRLRIRYRIDGILHEIQSPPLQFAAAIISRIKVLARLDISEKRLPQDGRIKMQINEKEIDIRVSTSPTIFGEKIVMRLFDKSQMLSNINYLGLSETLNSKLTNILKRNTGILLVTGPTGSGKTTTLYAALNQLDSLKKNIVTIEDPVEYQVENINQIEVNQKIGLTFANGLRSILRQDPDILMVGEIRDYETVEIAVRSALTGHFVMSTLHTNNAPDSLARLLDMGIEPYLIVSTVKAILAQRLVRVLCKDCRETFLPPKEILKEFGENIKDFEDTIFYTSRGCRSCKYTGYRGRIGIFELLEIDDEIKELIMRRASSEDIKKATLKQNMLTLKDDAFNKIINGITSLDEALSVLQGV